MLLRDSRWSYNTGATTGLSIGYVIGSGGELILNDPAGTETNFYYGGLGGGLGGGFKQLGKIKLPKLTIGRHSAGGAGSLGAFWSTGGVFMTSAFKGTELTESDLQGATVYVDAGAGILAGVSASVMLLGIDPLPLLMGGTYFAQDAIRRAPAVLVMYGVNIGPQFGWGVGGLIGYLR